MADIQSSEFMYKRIVNPGLDKLGHANRLGIRLKSSWMPKKSLRAHSQYQQPPKSSGHNRQKMTPNRLASPQRPASVAQTNGTAPPEYIQDMVIPIASNVQNDDINVQRSLSPKSFCSTTKFKQVPLPNVPTVSPRSSAKTPSYRPMSICSERYLTSVTPESRMASDSSGWNGSEQSVRLEAGQKALDRCRTLKRTSEVKSYRVDRLYYMSAAPCRLHHRYLIDENELKILKERSNSEMRRSRLAGEYRPLAEEGGQYQAPGHHHSQLVQDAEDGEGHTFITQHAPSKEHMAKDPASRPRSSRSAASSHSGILQTEDEAKSKKRIGSSKSVTFSEPNPELKIVGKAAMTGEDSGKESGVESGLDEMKIEDIESKMSEEDIRENDVDNIESGIDNADVDDSGEVQESDNDNVQNDDVENENREAVDDDVNVEDGENVDVDQTALDGEDYLDNVDTVNGENNIDDNGNNEQTEDQVSENDIAESGVDENMENFDKSVGEDVNGQQRTEEQTSEDQENVENEIVDNLENVDLETENEQLEPSHEEEETGQECPEEEDIDNGDSVPKEETQENSGDSVGADQVVLEDDEVNDGADDVDQHGTETHVADVDAILKGI